MKKEKTVEPTITISKNDGVITINIPERFDFNSHSEFRQAYCNNKKGIKYKLNFVKTAYIDSSALGMLLLMHEHNGGDSKKNILIVNHKETVTNIFKVANFDRIFGM